MKVGFGCEKSSFLEEILKLRAKIIFLVSYKNSSKKGSFLGSKYGQNL
jgi:hypothetical protein